MNQAIKLTVPNLKKGGFLGSFWSFWRRKQKRFPRRKQTFEEGFFGKKKKAKGFFPLSYLKIMKKKAEEAEQWEALWNLVLTDL